MIDSNIAFDLGTNPANSQVLTPRFGRQIQSHKTTDYLPRRFIQGKPRQHCCPIFSIQVCCPERATKRGFQACHKRLTDCELFEAVDARVRFGAAYLAAEVLRGVKSMRVEFGAGPRDHCWLMLLALQGSAKTFRIMLLCLV